MVDADGDTGRAARPLPSARATRRLQESLEVELQAYRVDLGQDLSEVSRAGSEGRPDDALDAIRSHLTRLEDLRRALAGVVAGAVAEREAESVLDDLTDAEPAAASSGAHRGIHPIRRGVLATAAVVALALAGVNVLPDAPDPLLAAVTASEQALAAAASAGSGRGVDVEELTSLSLTLHDAIDGLPPEVLREPRVRAWLRGAMADHRSALLGLADTLPTAAALLDDLDRLASSLDIPLPPDAPGPRPAEGPGSDLDEGLAGAVDQEDEDGSAGGAGSDSWGGTDRGWSTGSGGGSSSSEGGTGGSAAGPDGAPGDAEGAGPEGGEGDDPDPIVGEESPQDGGGTGSGDGASGEGGSGDGGDGSAGEPGEDGPDRVDPLTGVGGGSAHDEGSGHDEGAGHDGGSAGGTGSGEADGGALPDADTGMPPLEADADGGDAIGDIG